MARVGDAEALLAVVSEHQPDLALVDVRMPPTYEDEGMRAAARSEPTSGDGGARAFPARRDAPCGRPRRLGGGFGYLLKDRVLDVDDFLEAAERVAAGGTALDPEVVDSSLAGPRRPSRRR